MEFSHCTPSDMEAVLELELNSFPADEAADVDSLQLRLDEAGDFFYVLKEHADGRILGFINGTCIVGPNLEHDSMSTHAIHGEILVIHSVTVRKSERRKGHALYMLHRYVSYMKKRSELKEIRLLTKPLMINLYLKAGFKIIGMSSIIHGSESWFEMKMVTEVAQQLTVDAFTNVAFKGNPAAVVFEQRHANWMQKVACENNLAETSFVTPIQGSSEETYALTWFTPTKEVELCGHATLGAAAALYYSKRVSIDRRISFITPHSGTLYAHQLDGFIFLNFPATPPNQVDLTEEEVESVLTAFQIKKSDILYTGRSLYDILVEINPSAFKSLVSTESPVDFAAIAKLGGRGLILTAAGEHLESMMNDQQGDPSTTCDFASRCFFPCYGVPEDSVTGSAHCCLAPYWGQKLSKSSMVAFQASTRGGVLKLEITEDLRVLIGGNSRIVIQSEIIAGVQ